MARAAIVVYDSTNRELRTVPDAFAAGGDVDLLSWRQGIKAGATISVGTELADLYWTDGRQEVIRAPARCAGAIEFTNRRINYDELPYSPSQVLLRLRMA